jgi:hypothetical protein
MPSCHLRILTLLLAAVPTGACATGCFTEATTLQTRNGEVKAILADSDDFPRFDLPDHGGTVRASDLADDADLLIVERGGEARALSVDEMAWHHVADGSLGGHPIAVVY